jgi:hypothetical protein
VSKEYVLKRYLIGLRLCLTRLGPGPVEHGAGMTRFTSKTICAESDQLLATRMSKLWPHREHESNAMKNMCCGLGLHRWRQLNLKGLGLIDDKKEVRFCFWCSKVKVDGVIYAP